jgi:hypothetical protein
MDFNLYLKNYIEAADLIVALKADVHPSSVRKPLAYTTVRRRKEMIPATERSRR